jgi:hypothetical protein
MGPHSVATVKLSLRRTLQLCSYIEQKLRKFTLRIQNIRPGKLGEACLVQLKLCLATVDPN